MGGDGYVLMLGIYMRHLSSFCGDYLGVDDCEDVDANIACDLSLYSVLALLLSSP